MKTHPLALLIASFAISLMPVARASAPQVKTQAPGFYRMMVGSIEVTVLFDGFFPMDVKQILNKAPAKKVDQLMAASFQGDKISTSVNSFLINTGTKLVLVDTGSGAFFGPAFGKVADNLKAAGYSADQVDEIVITHAHTDHLGGVTLNGKAVFAKATLHMDQKDADFWLNPANSKNPNEQVAGMVTNAIAAVAPYKAADHFKPFQGQTEIAPGITALPAYGHTPGHTFYAIESEGKKLLLVGDLAHIQAVQMADPSIAPEFDSDPKTATAERQKVLKDVAMQKTLVGFAHFPFPGIGHVVAAKPGYRFMPIPYGPVQ